MITNSFFNFTKSKPFGQTIFDINQNEKIYKSNTLILKQLNAVNWNKNRPFDSARVQDIKQSYKDKNVTVIPGIIYMWDNGYILQIYDGIHRYQASLETYDMEIILHVFTCPNEEQIKNHFLEINKSVSIPCVYLEDNNFSKRTVCEFVATSMVTKFKDNVSSTRRCHKQNFNRDNLIDFIGGLNIDFEMEGIEFFLLNELLGLNFGFCKDYVVRTGIQVPKKTHSTNLYIFWCNLDILQRLLEKSCNMYCKQHK